MVEGRSVLVIITFPLSLLRLPFFFLLFCLLFFFVFLVVFVVPAIDSFQVGRSAHEFFACESTSLFSQFG